MDDTRNPISTPVLGRDAGLFGRWARLVVGMVLLGDILWDAIMDAPPLGYYGS